MRFARQQEDRNSPITIDVLIEISFTTFLEGVRPLIDEALQKATEPEDYSALFKSMNPE